MYIGNERLVRAISADTNWNISDYLGIYLRKELSYELDKHKSLLVICSFCFSIQATPPVLAWTNQASRYINCVNDSVCVCVGAGEEGGWGCGFGVGVVARVIQFIVVPP